MTSVCPRCLSENEHQASKGPIKCTGCDTPYDPSQQDDSFPPIDDAMLGAGAAETPKQTAAMAEPEPTPVVETVLEEGAELSAGVESTPPVQADQGLENVAADFSLDPPGPSAMGEAAASETSPMPETIPENGFDESESVFEELRTFGESVLPGEEPTAPANAPAQANPPASTESVAPPSKEIETPSAEEATQPSLDTSGEIRMTSGSSLQGFAIEDYLSPLSLSTPVDTTQEDPLHDAFLKLWKRAQQAGGNAVVDLRWTLASDSSSVLVAGTPVRCRKEN